MTTEATERYLQIGVTALRDPGTGEFLPAVPLYVKADDVTEAEEQSLIDDIGKLLAARFRAYKTGCESAGVII